MKNDTKQFIRGACLATTTLVVFVIATAFLPARAQQLTVVRVNAIPIAAVAPLYAAIEQGYFRNEGLEITGLAQSQQSTVGVPGLMANVYDIAYANSVTALLAIQQGIDLRFIAGSTKTPAQPPDIAAIIARKVDGLHSGKDLEGKTVAIGARNSIASVIVQAWVKATGGDPNKVTFREVIVPQTIDALKNKQVDAALALDPFLTFAKKDPDLTIVDWPYYVVAPAKQWAFWLATGDTADNRRDVIEKFVRGLEKGGAWVDANLGTEPYLKLVSGYTKVSPELILSMPPAHADTAIDIDSLKRAETLMRENGLLTAPIDVAAKVFVPRK